MCKCHHKKSEHVFAAWLQTACWQCECDEYEDE